MESSLRELIESAINRVSAENGSDTPDFILAEYLCGCLAAYDKAVNAREKWYGRECGGGAAIVRVHDLSNVKVHTPLPARASSEMEVKP
jgi:hypothetical protein